MFSNLENITPNILVIGDLMLDHYLLGSCQRISPEAPVQVVDVRDQKDTLGGAGNVVNNLLTLGANTDILSVIGDDENGELLKKRLEEKNINHHLITQKGRITSKKTRVIASNQQIVRFDHESKDEISSDSEGKLLEFIKNNISKYDAVILSDYNKGVLSDKIISQTIQLSKNTPILVDPKGTDYSIYDGASVITPNKQEACSAVGFDIKDQDDVIKAGKLLQKNYNIQNVIITLSEDGMAIFSDEVSFIPTIAREVFDVTGAGDTVISTLAFSLAANQDILESAKLANSAAAVAVSKLGSSVVSLEEIKEYQKRFLNRYDTEDRIKSFDEIKEIVQNSSDKKIVFTNGCFDILHVGHVKYLQNAKEFGDILILGINSDRSVRELKGQSRPINSEIDRAYILSALHIVDFVVVFDTEDELYELIKLVSPDVLVKGADYEGKSIVGSDVSKKVELIKFIDGKSTSKTIEKIQKR